MTATDATFSHGSTDLTIERLTRSSAAPLEVVDGIIVSVDQQGQHQVTDLRPIIEENADHPDRKRGIQTVYDADSFLGYFTRHAEPESEIWADPVRLGLTGVIDAHKPLDGTAGWRAHRVTLALKPTIAWDAWLKRNGQMMSQADFAELVEARLIDIVSPPAADMLELAQSFQATRSVAFEAGKRLKSGETQLEYRETIEATAGKAGRLAIPDEFELGICPFEGSEAFRLIARFRYRISGDGKLAVGYVLERPEDVQRAAFDKLLDQIRGTLSQPVWTGTP